MIRHVFACLIRVICRSCTEFISHVDTIKREFMNIERESFIGLETLTTCVVTTDTAYTRSVLEHDRYSIYKVCA